MWALNVGGVTNIWCTPGLPTLLLQPLTALTPLTLSLPSRPAALSAMLPLQLSRPCRLLLDS